LINLNLCADLPSVEGTQRRAAAEVSDGWCWWW
jgi:hypothetical protein